MPVESTRLPDENPAARADPTKPVAQEDWAKLPRRPQSGNKLDRAAFVYDTEKDCYYCPMGRTLVFVQIKTKGRDTCAASEYRVYKCHLCEGCGLAADCLAGNLKRRTVSYDQHEPIRQEGASRLKLKTESGRTAYAKRAHLAETPNGVIKQVMGLRQFLLLRGAVIVEPRCTSGLSEAKHLAQYLTRFLAALGMIPTYVGIQSFLLPVVRGLGKVRTEWLWVCTAFHLRKLIFAMEKLRTEAMPEPV